MDKHLAEPGTPAEVRANMRRIAREAAGRGRAHRLLDRRGGRLNSTRQADVEAAADELEAAGAVITQVHKQGFPAATAEETAIDEALQTARQYGKPITAEIVRTPEHEAAGEYLVKILLIAKEGKP